jgi:uncharacterized protein YjbI with pentapeptide repeats
LTKCRGWNPGLFNTVLCGADLIEACLGELHLRGDWSGAKLHDAYLHVVDVVQPFTCRGADLSGCSITVRGPVREKLLKLLSPEQRNQVKLRECFLRDALVTPAAWLATTEVERHARNQR